MTWQRKPSPPLCCGTVVEPFIRRSALTQLKSSTWRGKPGPPILLCDCVGGFFPHSSAFSVGDAQHRPGAAPAEKERSLCFYNRPSDVIQNHNMGPLGLEGFRRNHEHASSQFGHGNLPCPLQTANVAVP